MSEIMTAYRVASWFGDARRCRAPRHEGLKPHPEERALARVSKDEVTELGNALD